MVLTESILVNNPCYKEAKTIKVQGLMLEGVRCPQPSARVFAHNWNRENCDNKCVHAFIDANDGCVIQTLPWEYRARHCGKHPRTKMSANETHIGIKMCEPSQIRYKTKNEIVLVGNNNLAIAAAKRTYETAVELFAELCKQFDLDPKTDIVSQKEGYERGIAALHNDPELLWRVLGLNYSMNGFRQDVMIAMGDCPKKENLIEIIPSPIEEVKSEIVMNPMVEEVKNFEPVIAGLQEGIEEGYENPIIVETAETITSEPKIHMVKVTVDNLRIRSTPGIGNNTTGKYTGKGIFEISEIQNGSGSKKGWGKLRNGAGWICLDFVEMIE